jgi:hemolysin activation/secretion protein
LERIEVDETADRFISEEFMGGPEVFQRTLFANLEVNYQYNAIDNAASPTRGMYFRIKSGVRTNLERANRTYGYIHPALQFFNALNPTRTLVLRTAVEGQFNLGRNYEFYQAAVLGANTGLRGFRTERFSGDSALGFSGDLRYRMARFKTGLLPLELGVFTGGDVGRVWFHQEDTNNWHGDYGLGFWLSAADTVAGQLGLFNSNEGLRVTIGIGFDI